MKISGSVYSSKSEDLAAVIKDLDDHRVDMFHIDCNDDPRVFDDIASIRELSSTPIDLHIISPDPSKYFDRINELKVDYVTIQLEDLEEELMKPPGMNGQFGLAVTSNTEIEAFDPYADQLDFILFMATIPGQSGGQFDKSNFEKIRKFKARYPDKRVHVDGGVNNEVSFILRNMGVYASVSGSYLMNSDSMGAAMVELKTNEVESHFEVRDFMRTKSESPILGPGDRSIGNVLQSIEDNKLGFTVLVDDNGKLEGMISNADVRKGMLKNLTDLNAIRIEDITNPDPVVANEKMSVQELLKFVKRQSFPISYLPVVNDNKEVTGVVTFVNLIKGEL